MKDSDSINVLMGKNPDFATESRKQALKKYKEEKAKFVLQMMTMGYYKMKSLLSEEGLKKVDMLDQRRRDDSVFNNTFSEETWKGTEEVWENALEPLIIQISSLYGLTPKEDIEITNSHQEEEDRGLDFYA